MEISSRVHQMLCATAGWLHDAALPRSTRRRKALPGSAQARSTRTSTLGGMTGKTLRTTSPSASIWRSVLVSIFWLMPPISSPRRVKRSLPCSLSTYRASIVHLSATRPMISRTNESNSGSSCCGGTGGKPVCVPWLREDTCGVMVGVSQGDTRLWVSMAL
jgi:hypothetical protein